MASPDIAVRGVRQSLPQGYILGRVDAGPGPAQLIAIRDLADKIAATGVVSTPGSVTGLTPIATARVLGNTSGGSAIPTAQALTAPAAGLTITPGAGAFTFALADDLAALEALGSTGIAARTAPSTWAQRSIAVGSAKLTVSNGSGVSGNPTLDLGAVSVFDLTDFLDEDFWALLSNAAATCLACLDLAADADGPGLRNVDCGSLALVGDTLTADFEPLHLGRLVA